jgi:two-component system, NtrC family, response regulator PilR
MRALVLDDEQGIRKTLKVILAESGIEVYEAGSLAEAQALIKDFYFDMAVVDIRLPDGSGIDVLKSIKETSPETVVLVITAFASTETAIETMKSGAYDYVTKPFNLDEIRIVFKNISDKIRLESRVKELQQYADAYQNIIGKSDSMRRLFGIIDKVAPFDSHVLIIGESGAGKELVAKALHDKSRRAHKRLVAINCASLPSELLESELFGYARGAFTGAYTSKRGLIEDADGGTLFLDEIGEMPQPLQAKLLRFLEEKKIRPLGSGKEIDVDVRIIAATNRTFKELLEKGEFREDLYYRLCTFELRVPSLRERREDIPILVDHFIRLYSEKFGKKIVKVDPAFMDYMMKHDLRGNVRELKNIIEREVILSDDGCIKLSGRDSHDKAQEISADIPDAGMDLNDYLSNIEKDFLQKALERSSGVKTRAAELLGLTFREFRYKLSKYKNPADNE